MTEPLLPNVELFYGSSLPWSFILDWPRLYQTVPEWLFPLNPLSFSRSFPRCQTYTTFPRCQTYTTFEDFLCLLLLPPSFISQAFLFDKHVSQQVSSCISNSIPVFLPGTHAIIKFVLSINKAKLTYISCLTTTLPMGLYLTPCNSSTC